MKALYIVILVVISSSLYAQNDCNKLKADYDKLSKTFDKKADEFESFKQKNKELDNLLASQQKEIEQQKATLVELIAKGKEGHEQMMLAKAAIEQYESLIVALQGKLEELVKTNETLSKENERLKKQ